MDTYDQRIADLATIYVEDMLQDVDPGEERYPDAASIKPLVHDLALTIDGAIGDWLLERRAAFGPVGQSC